MSFEKPPVKNEILLKIYELLLIVYSKLRD